jgi:hypothetical protein
VGSFARMAGSVAGATLAGATMLAAPSTANALERIIAVPCNTARLIAAIAQANATVDTTIRLAGNCTYLTRSSLVLTGRDTRLVGGPSTVIKADPAQPPFGPILGVFTGATVRVQGIFIIGGNNPIGGGGIANAGTLTLSFVTVTGNAADVGGGVFNTGRLLVIRTVIKANTANQFGGGIANTATLTVVESVVSGNHAGGTGGGIENGGTAAIRQSTIDKNTAATGGGITNEEHGTTTVDRSLVEQNKAGPGLASGGGILRSSGTVILRRSIVRFNAPTNCSPVGGIPGCTG